MGCSWKGLKALLSSGLTVSVHEKRKTRIKKQHTSTVALHEFTVIKL